MRREDIYVQEGSSEEDHCGGPVCFWNLTARALINNSLSQTWRSLRQAPWAQHQLDCAPPVLKMKGESLGSPAPECFLCPCSRCAQDPGGHGLWFPISTPLFTSCLTVDKLIPLGISFVRKVTTLIVGTKCTWGDSPSPRNVSETRAIVAGWPRGWCVLSEALLALLSPWTPLSCIPDSSRLWSLWSASWAAHPTLTLTHKQLKWFRRGVCWSNWTSRGPHALHVTNFILRPLASLRISVIEKGMEGLQEA